MYTQINTSYVPYARRIDGIVYLVPTGTKPAVNDSQVVCTQASTFIDSFMRNFSRCRFVPKKISESHLSQNSAGFNQIRKKRYETVAANRESK